MKNFRFASVLVLTLLVLLSACSQQSTGQDPATKVGFIYIGNIGTEGFTFSHDQARLYLEQELGIETMYQESVAENADVEAVIANMVDQGCNVIFGTSFGFGKYMLNVVDQYPNVKFLHCSGATDAANMNTYFGRMYEPRFLSGLVAGLKTKTNEIGYVAAYEIPEVIRGVNAFTLGVQTANPDAKVNVVWTHTWYDPAKEKDAALSLIDSGCDVIAQHQDTAAPQQAAEERGVAAVGYHSITEENAPNAYMTAPIWDWKAYYKSEVEKVMAGTWEPVNVWLGMKDGLVLLAPLTDNAPEGAKELIEDYQAKIIAGEFKVFDGVITKQDGTTVGEAGKTLSDNELLNMNYFINGINGEIITD
ncbi:BMP family ABC transporter substrate-binding protein [Clostridium sp. 'deep sea']|uniref:BMP family ABC transporter substrate-binding protein n=1 Tax=Clostridium sp. 'deep sea' TaxID=2779445 RepID=UPI0018964F41|nr:BMP family ABC transporter substrate-binding protein [Clostridium sp. 'deep sea']QOR34200.1 BMP family ABC transporter substrate-binding protein [Clostridium sp. 'deep sea']